MHKWFLFLVLLNAILSSKACGSAWNGLS
jgi:hypothetical protein